MSTPAAATKPRPARTLLAVVVALTGPPAIAAAGVYSIYFLSLGERASSMADVIVVVLAMLAGVAAVAWLLRRLHVAWRVLAAIAYVAAMAWPVMLAGFMGALCSGGDCRW